MKSVPYVFVENDSYRGARVSAVSVDVRTAILQNVQDFDDFISGVIPGSRVALAGVPTITAASGWAGTGTE
ncbi:hypothetical protein ACWCPQ_32680 [Nocardia sp. NPDC001965]